MYPVQFRPVVSTYCALIFVISCLCVGNGARASVGAKVPFLSYEGEAGLLGGGATIYYLTNPPTTQYSSPELEASGHAFVALTASGQYVQWTNNTGANITFINLRSCIPDAPAGGGITNTIDLYVNGTFRQGFSVSSKQNYNYEGTNYNGQTDKNPADGDPRDFWNDTHAFVTGAAIAAGSTLRFQKDSTNSASFYYIDVIDVENPPAPLAQPANSLSILSYGAVSNNPSVDNTAAINNCFSAALSQGKSAWIPAGTYYISSGSGLLNATGITISGAGPWYSAIYRSTTSGYVANLIQATSCSLSNVFLDCSGTNRDGGNNNGAVNFAGTNWVVNNVWIQHVTSAFWCAGLNGLAENCRVMSVWSDGGNFNQYQSGNGIGSNLTYSNNFVRGTGDDAMAINATEGTGYAPMNNIRYVSNTSIDAYGGKGIAVYGGRNLIVTNNLITDSARYDGIEVGYFEQSASISNALVSGNVLLRCGGNGYNDMTAALEVGIQNTNVIDRNITISGNVVSNSIYGGFTVDDCTNCTFGGNIFTMWNQSAYGVTIWANAIGNGSFITNTVYNLQSGQVAYVNNSVSFTATLNGNSWQRQSQIINFDAPGGESGGVNYSGQGVHADSGNYYWNAIVPNGTTPAGTNSDGFTHNSITFTEAQSSDYFAQTGWTNGTPQALEYYYAYVSGSGTNTCTLNNVPAGTYNLYLYGINGGTGANNSDLGTTFSVSIGSINYGSQSTVNSSNGFSSFVQSNSYVRFQNIVVSSNGGAIKFTYTHNTVVSGNTYGDFNGLQLVPAATAINFDVPGGAGGGNYNGQGALSELGENYWNPVVLNGTTSGGVLPDGATHSPITLTTPSLSTYAGNNYGGNPTGPELLFTPFAYSESSYNLTLNNVPAGTYNLYLYGMNGSGGGGSTKFTVGGSSITNIYNTDATTFVQGVDYGVITNIVLASAGTITIGVAGSGLGTGQPSEDDFNGLQLIPAANASQPLVQQQPTAGSPLLSIEPVSMRQLTLQWPDNGTKNLATQPNLYHAHDLTSPVAWILVSNTPVFANGQWTVKLPAGTNGTGFYKLQ